MASDLRFSGSASERVAACPASVALPQVRTPVSEHAERGTAIHAFLVDARTMPLDAALDRAPDEWRDACAAIPLGALPEVDAAGFAAEVALAYDVDSGQARELGRNIGRDYPELGPGEVPVTIDVGALTRDGGVFVGDFKAGRRRVTPAAANPQILLGALAACRAWGRSRAEVAVIYVREDAPPWYDRATLDEWDLDVHAGALREVARRVREAHALVADGRQPTLTTGEHCRYCPAYPACPAQVSLVQAIVQAPATWRTEHAEELTPARAAEAYRLFQLASTAVKRAGEQLYAYAQEVGGIDLGGGVVFGPVRTRREHVDGAVVRRVLAEQHGQAVADAACTWESSKSAVRAALRPLAATTGVPLARLEREALAAVRSAGGVDERVTVTIKEHVPRTDTDTDKQVRP